jgi:AcrR family transcriptional regulator
MSPRGRVRNEHMRQEALAKITSAALEAFAEYGYHGATMKQIARATGLSYGLVYHYFPSKEKIFRHLVDFALDGSIAGMHAFMDAPGRAWEKITQYSAMLIKEALTGESALYFLIMLQAMTQGKSIPGLLAHVEKRTEAYFEVFTPIIAQAQKSGEAKKGDPLVLSTAYFSFVQGLALFAFHRKGLEKKIAPDILISVLRNDGSK